MRAAKLSGNGLFLFPDGSTVEEVPWDLAAAIEFAIRICSWQENLMSEDMPPNWMLPFEDELQIWFEEVERRREERYGGGESVDLEQNELTERFRRG